MNDFFVKSLTDGGFRLEESNLREHIGSDYWHSTVVGKDLIPMSGGFSFDRSQARKIAVSEFLERKAYREIASSSVDVRASWGLDLIPTACGFACGFSLAGAIQRSVAEAVERWVASKWIDEDLHMDEVTHSMLVQNMDEVSLFLMSNFLDTRFFSKTVNLDFYSQRVSVVVGITLGITAEGIFVGSSAQKTAGNIWQHSLLESFRHLLALKNNPKVQMSYFPGNKVSFFSKNKKVALAQVDRKKSNKWSEPVIALHLNRPYENGQYYISRTIIDGWKSWTEGPIERFLY